MTWVAQKPGAVRVCMIRPRALAREAQPEGWRVRPYGGPTSKDWFMATGRDKKAGMQAHVEVKSRPGPGDNELGFRPAGLRHHAHSLCFSFFFFFQIP